MTSNISNTDELVITQFNPPTRAAFYSFIKNCRGRVVMVIVLSYFIISNLFPVIIGSDKLVQSEGGSSVLENKKTLHHIPTEKPGDPTTIELPGYIHEFHDTTHFGKPFLAFLIAIFLPFYLLRQLRRQRKLLLSTLYSVTNQRIIVQVGTQNNIKSMSSIYYRDKRYCTLLQTPIHRMLNIYSLYFSSEPVKNGMYNAIKLLNSSNDRLDILTQEQANQFVKIFQDIENNQLAKPITLQE